MICLLSPITQDPGYHNFADQRFLFGIPNFWNVASNVPFLLVALWGLRTRTALPVGERPAYSILLSGLALVACGSTYYHLAPDNDRLFWDRLPMTIVFMSVLAAVIGERVNPKAGRRLLLPLLGIGAASVLYWKFSGDLRLYAAVQFLPMLAIPWMLVRFPAQSSGAAGVYAMLGFYALAKAVELADRPIASIIATGGHPWKHVAGAIAMLCYVTMIHRRNLAAQKLN